MAGKQSDTDTPTRNREAWLTDAIALMVPIIKQRTSLSPRKPIKVSVGFPPSGGRTRSNTGKPGTVGVCITSAHHKHAHIFIHPMYDRDSILADKGVMEILAHETLHACLPDHVGHRKEFSQAAKKLGLEGKPTATLLSDSLRETFKALAEQLGDYPHDEGIESGGKTQTTRLLLCTCTMCGYKIRTTRTWLDNAGAPICPQDLIQMVEGAGDEGEMDNPLVPRRRYVEYGVKPTPEAKAKAKRCGQTLVDDPRWAIRMNANGAALDWWIVDYGEPFRVVDGQQIAVLGIVEPRLTHAESREDAIAVMEALRDGSMTYDEVSYQDIDNDPALDDDPDAVYDDGDDETLDFDDSDDPRFEWERERGIVLDPEAEADKREAWATRTDEEISS